ncbi:COX15/CtaA family protein [Thioalkalivibrio thiocyanoxidans]|uniref:COX15/CtaA family protein n=1 Tax=Thioalkalivibrio thiocyanoxidans TaxID=152475 RepID=UPI000360039D|nr:COX15/CtaA family protein [Thioalkalivibrio thiocyanoxidans]
MDTPRLFFVGVRFAFVLTLVVIVLGVYVRLSDAGLGCPDWPGCYGRLLAPTQPEVVEQANLAFPERPVDVAKAWKEMVHRYAAGLLGLVVLALAVLAWRTRHRPGQPVAGPILLLALIVFQSLLGMWTVTLQLKPVVVMAHLFGGFATLLLLWHLILVTRDLRRHPAATPEPRWAAPQARTTRRPPRRWLPHVAALATLVLVAQIALGGWTSANYAALACPDLPQCQGQWWPEADFREAFVLWRGTDTDYEFGVLEAPARTAIHMAHRIGAVTTVALLGGLTVFLLWRGDRRTRVLAGVALVLLLAQAGLGISNVLYQVPLPVAVTHNAMAALLLLAMFTLWRELKRTESMAAASVPTPDLPPSGRESRMEVPAAGSAPPLHKQTRGWTR